MIIISHPVLFYNKNTLILLKSDFDILVYKKPMDLLLRASHTLAKTNYNKSSI